MGRSKFNVDENKDSRTYDGIVFDSALEMRYYRDVVLPGVESGEISNYELQKKYELQPKFRHDGKLIRAIVYVADFYIEYSDGRAEVIDTKGFPDSMAKLKRKMFLFKFPGVDYRWMSYVKKYGGWIDYESLEALKKEAKKNKELKEAIKNGKE